MKQKMKEFMRDVAKQATPEIIAAVIGKLFSVLLDSIVELLLR